jgi:hypothetical protein
MRPFSIGKTQLEHAPRARLLARIELCQMRKIEFFLDLWYDRYIESRLALSQSALQSLFIRGG